MLEFSTSGAAALTQVGPDQERDLETPVLIAALTVNGCVTLGRKLTLSELQLL